MTYIFSFSKTLKQLKIIAIINKSLNKLNKLK